MLDINRIRNNREEVEKALLKKNFKIDFTELLDFDAQRRSKIFEVEQMKAKRNTVSGEIPKLKKQGTDVTDLLNEMKKISLSIAELEKEITSIEAQIKDIMDYIPNTPADDVVAGDATQNQPVRYHGRKPEFDFTIKDHVALCEALGIIDYKRGAKLSGSGHWMYRGDGALLEWALLNYFITEHIKDGYEFILPPHILNYECGYTAGQFPKFGDDVFKLTENDQFLLPTAETALINLHRNEVLREEELPKKYFAYTPCYRKEAGSYRAEERGMIRGHQFNKVEMFQYTVPEKSEEALMELVAKAEALMNGLGLHFRLSKLAAADCSFAMGKTYDVEVWIPSMGIYKEVSSASNAYDFQAIRGGMRFKRTATGKNEYLHTLNASGLATSRVFPAIIEQNQHKDGSVTVPEVLRKWVGKDKLTV
ncbi:MAG TPA: serine--tRNA ligase [Clostridia bacterium]|jgi:seryl-tRNA synthetase|nr:serine--tRNA ligase [Clostridiaceae bacterium]HOF25974.1 serine--tRNA ligase [Clostridia bacterium]HOM33583.1 serine--tRNA ligase [Clostridia bacterium]HOR88999.1 serine--tRNA ligase [Clostridia bacterium]HOT70151.1 serine--tRNA ligase [Clostridia bacterium]